MKTAFILLKSPEEGDPLQLLSRLSSKADATAILIEDGVYHAVSQHAASKLKLGVEDVLVCGDDLEARGFTQADIKIGKVAGYPEIIDCIMERTERTVTV